MLRMGKRFEFFRVKKTNSSEAGREKIVQPGLIIIGDDFGGFSVTPDLQGFRDLFAAALPVAFNFDVLRLA